MRDYSVVFDWKVKKTCLEDDNQYAPNAKTFLKNCTVKVKISSTHGLNQVPIFTNKHFFLTMLQISCFSPRLFLFFLTVMNMVFQGHVNHFSYWSIRRIAASFEFSSRIRAPSGKWTPPLIIWCSKLKSWRGNIEQFKLAWKLSVKSACVCIRNRYFRGRSRRKISKVSNSIRFSGLIRKVLW